MVKKMVRLALASEYARQPIRRTDISAKVLGEQGARQFKAVFEQAQVALREKFGMQMVELPGKEKVTVHQRRGEFFGFFFFLFFLGGGECGLWVWLLSTDGCVGWDSE
jgi:hypothetical protein